MSKVIANTISFTLILSIFLYAQSEKEKTGAVSFISGDIVFITFDNTEGINIGDTLYKNSIPVLNVISVSSKSASGNYLGEKINLDINDKIKAFVTYKKEEVQQQITSDSINKPTSIVNVQPENTETPISTRKDIYGRFSIQSYTTLNNTNELSDFQRWKYSFSLRADNLIQDKLNYNHYITFTYRTDNWKEVGENFGRALRVYDLHFNYKPFEEVQFLIGRNINRKVSNLGSSDGLQGEIRVSNFNLGGILGFRPNYTDMGFNSKLLQYGFYINRSDTSDNNLMENTAALMQQTNNSKVDRRFLYFQHSNNLIKNIYFFASAEADLYQRTIQSEKNELTFTGAYLMLRVNPIKGLDFSVSYDARKNVIYYETFKTYLDSLFENEIRQGFNINSNIKIFTNMHLSLNYGSRFRKGDIKTSRNYGGSLSYYNIPFIKTYAGFTYNKIISNYLSGDMMGLRMSKNLEFINSDISLALRNNNYNYGKSKGTQNSVGVDLNTKISKMFYFNLSYESVIEKEIITNRFFIDFNTRF